MFRAPNRSLSRLPLAVLLASEVLSVATTSCGPKLFPDCGKPGVSCPPCTGNEVYPDPCAGTPKKRDAGRLEPDK